MKNIISLALLAISTSAFSQVIIGDNVGTAADKTSVLLEFAKTENKGIVLPYVTTLPANPTEGTILVDAVTATEAAVKYYNGTWVNLSGEDKADITTSLSIQNTTTEADAAKAIIGDSKSDADGVLVLESTEKAMVLPHVESVQDVLSPAPGMMVYVAKTGGKRLAVFNGSKWTFWGK